MAGLLIVGVVHGAAEGDVAAAVATAASRDGQAPAVVAALAFGDRDARAVHAFARPASPVTAARHLGVTLDPEEIVQAIAEHGESVVVSVGGGLLAPITPRYSVRDLAVDIGLPVVLVAPAGPDAVGLLRMSAEAVRGAGLAVAAVVLSAWPETPDRVLLDERRLLEEVAGRVPMAVLPSASGARADAVQRWEVARWFSASAAPEAGQAIVTAGRVEAALEPYIAWEPAPVGDPRATPRPRIMEAMLEIIAAEGPMRASRAYSLYNRASGGKKLTTIARAPLSSAVHWLAQERKIVLTKREEIPWQDDDIVRLPDTPAVRVRELGPRTLEEVPLDEIAELMRRLKAARGITTETELKRAILSTYGLVRMTSKADEYLGLAAGLLGE